MTDPPAPEAAASGPAAPFEVRLDNFEGPFDLLLSLIGKHKLDITEVALSRVTDEFIAHVKVMGRAWDLEQTSSFLLVAATLLDLKAARLLPQGDVEDEEDLALLEARDLLFARLLQYKAFKLVAGVLEGRLAAESRRHPRAVGLEERYAGLLPEVLIGIGLDQFAALAARALEPKPEPELSLHHIHAPAVSVREQAVVVVDRLRHSGTLTFRSLCRDSPDTLTTVARFLSLLELFREGAVSFDQLSPLGELQRAWTGGSEDADESEIDEFEGVPEPAPDATPAPRRPTERARTSQGTRTTQTDPNGRTLMTQPTTGHDVDTLDVAVAEPRPALEALLMVADQPLDVATLASATGHPVPEVDDALAALAREYDEQGAASSCATSPVAGATTRAEAFAPVVEAFVLTAAGPTHPGRARDARRGGLQAAGVAGPGVGHPRRQRRRRDAHAPRPWPGRGGGPRRRARSRRSTGPPATSWSGCGVTSLDSCGARALPARHGRPRARSGRGGDGHAAAEAFPEPQPEPAPGLADEERST